MDPGMDDIIQDLRDFAHARDWDQFHSPKNLAMALAVESAELLEHFQWLTEDQSRKLDDETRAQVRQEIGDVLLYLTRLADQLDISPLDAAREKLKLNAEKYPVEASRGHARKVDRRSD